MHYLLTIRSLRARYLSWRARRAYRRLLVAACGVPADLDFRYQVPFRDIIHYAIMSGITKEEIVRVTGCQRSTVDKWLEEKYVPTPTGRIRVMDSLLQIKPKGFDFDSF